MIDPNTIATALVKPKWFVNMADDYFYYFSREIIAFVRILETERDPMMLFREQRTRNDNFSVKISRKKVGILKRTFGKM